VEASVTPRDNTSEASSVLRCTPSGLHHDKFLGLIPSNSSATTQVDAEEEAAR